MPNLASILKEEIRRLARKEVKAVFFPVKQDAVALKKRMAGLAKRLARLEKDVAFAVSQVGRQVKVAATLPVEDKRVRITAKGMRSMRRKMRLTQAEFAALLGVTGQAVYQWESKQGPLRVRERVKRSILAVRDLGAREARRLVEELAGAKTQKKRGRPRGRGKAD